MSADQICRSELYKFGKVAAFKPRSSMSFLHGKSINVPDPIRVQISSQVVKIVEQLPEALGLSQLSIVMKSNTDELKFDHPVEQHLDLVTLGDPTPEMLKVIDAARHIASTAFDR